MSQVLRRWFLLAVSTILLLLLLPQQQASAAGIAPSPMPLLLAPPDKTGTGSCPMPSNMCGGVEIPYPFGIGEECSLRPEFSVICNNSFSPPKPYTGNIEITSISLLEGEMRVYGTMAYRCYNSSNTTTTDSDLSTSSNLVDPFRISARSNVFTAIGCSTVAFLEGGSSYFTGCISTCASLDAAARDGDECAGLGCCQTPIPGNLSAINVSWGDIEHNNSTWEYSPCSYAFVGKKGWYNYSRRDLSGGNNNFTSRYGSGIDTTIPLVLAWAITDTGTCQQVPAVDGEAEASAKLPSASAPACVSGHSYCSNISATQGLPGYLCNCSQGYSGNPYVTNGCTNINECEEYDGLCCRHSTCHDTEGDYMCKCKFGLRDGRRDAKGCQPIVQGYAMATVAIIVAVVLACVTIALLLRREGRKCFSNNGGDILKKAAGITIYTKGQLNKITKNYSKRIGRGYFSDVFLGTIIDDGGKQVAVKKLSVAKKMARRRQKTLGRREAASQQEHQETLWKEGFVTEITFLFQIKHPNVVRLVGCCLETDVPILVFDYVSNGSLDKVLHGDGTRTPPCALSLAKRMGIAIGSAEAISHIHSHGAGGDHNHVHGDIKPANILIDDDHKPKVSDFGSSRLLSKNNRYAECVPADKDYADPIYFRTQQFTDKSDVYSFGVVLLELITRKKARYGNNKILTIEFERSCEDHGNGRQMYDAEITSSSTSTMDDMECIDMVAALAVRCLSGDPNKRPTMADVVKDLNNARFKLLNPAVSVDLNNACMV